MQDFEPVPFYPRRYLSNGHLQTIIGNYLHRIDALPPPLSELVEVSPATQDQIASQVLCHCHWQPDAATKPAAIIVHGLEGSSNSQYVVGNANKLWRAGCSIIRMNMRNCGGTEQLSPTLYHSGLSGDVRAVMDYFLATRHLQSVSLIGYSMGGNLVLKLAGELGTEAPPQLHSVIGVSPAVDLGPSADALHRPFNRLYEWKFLRALLKRFRRKAALFPRAYDVKRADYIHSLRQFDDEITAIYSGFSGADDYYFRAAAGRVLDQIAVPTLILHAADDPFVYITPESRSLIAANPSITYVEPAHGGHCAFLASADPSKNDDGYWAESTLLRFLLAHA
ncbi:YheT family hydrolase [Granulicella arctica]|uniref:YheT family hydrolase n=1 Tax=Granulicella arctica TaxID=940613 RepID=UPI0021DF6F56|nr:alpha/beta fold hydrolase [Granulicella arctica]